MSVVSTSPGSFSTNDSREVGMKRVLRALVTATTVLAVIAAPAAAIAAAQDADPGGLQGRLDDVVAAGAVGVLAEVREEHGVWRGTSGVAELGTTRAVPVGGRFRAGSITKTFLARATCRHCRTARGT
jgi:D-alanyl-D-alanine carboxypeptidase